jgi:glycosyltransferase involved in cell wall biosynthesis
MNILLCCPFDLSRPGGVTTVVETLTQRLRASGDRIVLLKPTHGVRVTRSTVDGVTRYDVPMRGYVAGHPWRSLAAAAAFLPLTCWRLARILRRERIAIVNAHYFVDAWLYFVALRALLPFRLVLSVHGSDVQGAEGVRNRRLIERSAPLLDGLVFCSDSFRRQSFAPRSPVERVSRVIWNGTTCDIGAADEERRHAICCIAHLNEEKGPDVLLAAFHLLAADFPELVLHFVGDGPMRAALAARTDALHLSDRVYFHGRLAPAEAIAMLRRAQVACLPSRREAFGLAVIEAMATRTPVVATRAGGIVEIIRDGVDGLLVAPEQPDALAAALRRVLTDAPLRGALAAEGERRVAAHFTASRFIDEYRALFAELAARQATHPTAAGGAAQSPAGGAKDPRSSTLVTRQGELPAKTA